MANLSFNDLVKRDGERTLMVTDKVFEVGDKAANFQTDGGLFSVHSISIGNEVWKRVSSKATNKKKSLEAAEWIMEHKGGRAPKIEFIGKFKGKRSDDKIPLSKFFKSEEFGGATGTKINKGIAFENDIEADLRTCIVGKKCKGKFAKAMEILIDLVSKAIRKSPRAVISLGAQNQSRPIAKAGNQLVVLPRSHKDHGAKLTDIDLEMTGQTKVHLSLKFGSGLTFFNAGVAGKIFPANEIKTGQIKNDLGKEVLKTLGLNNKKFCSVFRLFIKSPSKLPVPRHKEDITKKVDLRKLTQFLQTAIGSDYWMVHGKPNGKIEIWYHDPKLNVNWAKPTGKIVAFYGGIDGHGKRVDIKFDNSFFDFKLNIRNTSSGVYPDKMQLAYTPRSGISITEI